ncbi:MAG: phosphoheptose isomerase [Burkholderiales bacterium PBB1]|nr:MAG: phosphoheptose isomerase [Burkholderiales bacterium PBB1]
METMIKSTILSQMAETQAVMAAMASDVKLVQTLETVAEACVKSLGQRGKLLFMGNGGSAADSQHLAGELVSRFAYDRPGLSAVALTVDTSILTAIGNDYGYESLFSRQVEALGQPGDVLFGFTTSGKSPNILKALRTARAMGLVTVGMTGNRGEAITQLVDHCVEIPSACTPNIQEGHIVVGHIICGLIEASIFPKPQ